MSLHICLVSDQLLANYIPIMMHKPDQVHLVSSEYVKDKGLTARFEKILEQQGFTVVLHDGMPDSNMQSIREYAEQLAQTIDQLSPNATITLNITGGNKLMVLGMWEVFNGGVEVIYTDTFHHCIEHLHDQRKEPFKSVLDVKYYLQAHGVRYLNALSDNADWLQGVQERKAVTKYLAKNAESLSSFIGMINALVANATEQVDRQLELCSPVQTIPRTPRGMWLYAVEQLHKGGLISWDGDRQITFTDVESARYIGGIWLEEYAYLSALDAGAEYVASSVKINWEKSRQTTNELDLIIVHQNRMLVIECKTLRFGNNEQKDSDMVYKISNLGDELQGLFGRTMLVSARNPNPVLIERAKSRQLKIIVPSKLKDLHKEIQYWMNV